MQFQNSSISNFKRFLFAILLPLLVTIAVGGYVVNYFFERHLILKNPLNGEYKINRILTETYPGEIPIFGSSRAAYVFIPDSLGTNYFNYGLAGTRYDVTLFFLEQECKKTKTTPWIVLNFDLEGLGYGLGDPANYLLNCNEPAVRALLGKEYKGYFSIPFIKYYGRYENYVRLYLSNKMELTKFTNKGAAIDKNVLPADEFEELVNVRRKTVTTFKNDAVLQQRLLNLITNNANRNFLFVVSPYHPSYFEGFSNYSDAEKFLNVLTGNKNVHVLNYGKMPLPDNMYLNTTHINLKGALVFNHELRDTLNAMGIH